MTEPGSFRRAKLRHEFDNTLYGADNVRSR
jgi:hypothetical protein